jgi:hypothetical protein
MNLLSNLSLQNNKLKYLDGEIFKDCVSLKRLCLYPASNLSVNFNGLLYLEHDSVWSPDC